MLCNFPLMILGNFFPRHAHKSTVMQIRWNQNGNWLLTASRDHLLKLFDIRMMKEMQTFRGHKREATGRNNVTFEIIHFMFFKHFSGTLDLSRLIHRGKKTVALVLSTVVFFPYRPPAIFCYFMLVQKASKPLSLHSDFLVTFEIE